MREIVLDTETTGFEPSEGHRLVEIGAIELINHIATDKVFHQYINPERNMPEGAFNVHGLSEEFLSDKPLFTDVVDAFLDFIGDDPLVIHNAAFDMKFLNFELQKAGYDVLKNDPIDTLMIARRKNPGGRNSLDELCKRYNVDNSGRTLHGALLDSELLAEVYIELIEARQTGMDLAPVTTSEKASGDISVDAVQYQVFDPSRITDEERKSNRLFVADRIGDKALWANYDV